MRAVRVLSELVQHHVKEEEGELLGKLKESDEDLEMMAETVKKRKMKLMNSRQKKMRKAS